MTPPSETYGPHTSGSEPYGELPAVTHRPAVGAQLARRTFQQAVAHVLDLPADTHPDELTAHIALLRAERTAAVNALALSVDKCVTLTAALRQLRDATNACTCGGHDCMCACEETHAMDYALDAADEALKDDHPSEWTTHMRSLLGKQVEVTLQREPERHVVTGRLLWFDEGGEVALQGDDGYIRRGWPNLDTRALGGAES